MTTPPPELDRLVRALDARKNGAGWKALCPCHADQNPSLSIRVLDGRIVVNCFGGCDNATVRAELRRRGLLPDPDGDIEATYDYRDAQGVLLFQVVRKKGKQFRQRRPDGKGRWVWKLDGVERVLYRLPELLAADPHTFVFVPEGEKDVERLRALGLVATTNSGGAGKWQKSYSEALRGRHVVVLPDNDQPGRDHARDVSASLQRPASSVRVLELPGLPDKGDVSDWLAAGGSGAMLEYLARMIGPIDPEPAGEPSPPPEPVAAPEDGAALLEGVDAFLARYVAFPSQEARHAVALWVGHAHAPEAFESTPRLGLLSAEKQSGKTRTLECMELLVPTPRFTSNLSVAALFRLVADGGCTLFMDEVDVYFGHRAREHEELRGLLNAGHRKGAVAYRCVGEPSNMEVKAFPAYCPVTLAGLGELPDTILDRAVLIRMRRRAPGETVTPFRRRVAQEEGHRLRDQLGAWVGANKEALAAARPGMPEGITDRPADVWEPLLAVADLAGGRWPERARAAALKLNAERQKADSSFGARLLADVRVVFTAKQADRLTSAALVEGLVAIEEAPWGALPRGGKPLDARGLARRLKPFDVQPKVIRVGDATPRGYERGDFSDAWARYLAPVPAPEGSATSATSATSRSDGVAAPGAVADAERNTPPDPQQDSQVGVADVADVAAPSGRDAAPGRTRVVNRKHGEPFDVDVGRPGPWGNPFGEAGSKATVVVASREDAVAACHDWLAGKSHYASVEPERRAFIVSHVGTLAGRTLGCYCAPPGGVDATDRPHVCHGQVLAELADASVAAASGGLR